MAGKGVELIRFTRRNLTLKVSLLVVQVLQLQVQAINFLARFGGLGFDLARGEAGVSVQPSQVSNIREKELLLLGDVSV